MFDYLIRFFARSLVLDSAMTLIMGIICVVKLVWLPAIVLFALASSFMYASISLTEGMEDEDYDDYDDDDYDDENE